jgi:hypothetical protein
VSIKELGISSLIAMLCALLTVCLWVFGGRFFFGPVMLAWPMQVFGLGALIFAVRRHRHWWLLWFAPILFAPLALWLALFFECARGNCL